MYGANCPLAGKLLADCERHVGHGAQHRVRGGRLVADRLFQEIDGARRHALAIGGGFGHAEPVVVVRPDHRSRSHGLTQRRVPFRGDRNGLTRFAKTRTLGLPEAPYQGPDALPAVGHVALHLLDQVVQVLASWW